MWADAILTRRTCQADGAVCAVDRNATHAVSTVNSNLTVDAWLARRARATNGEVGVQREVDFVVTHRGDDVAIVTGVGHGLAQLDGVFGRRWICQIGIVCGDVEALVNDVVQGLQLRDVNGVAISGTCSNAGDLTI